MRTAFLAVFSLVVGGSANAVEMAETRAAVRKALPLIQKGAAGHMANRTCFACHHQAIPMLAVTTARDRGLAVADEELGRHLDFISAFLGRNRDNYRQGRGQGGQVDTAGYALWTLETGGRKPDETTAAVAEYLLQRDKDLGHWKTTSNRPPSEASPFTTTYLAIRGLQTFGSAEQKERLEPRLQAIRTWLVKTQAKDTEDRVFRLWAMKRGGVAADQVQAAAQELLGTQRTHGGWAQRDELPADAYATGTALVALHEAAGLPTAAAAYQRGLQFLLDTQEVDGSWHVVSRSKPFQTYFESGFPHATDQFISLAATSWATTALALALPSLGQAQAAPAGLGRRVTVPALERAAGQRATVVVFLTADCPIAAGYVATLRKLATDYAGRGVAFVGIDVGDDAGDNKWDLPFPITTDPDGNAASAVAATTTPEIFVLDEGRVLRYRGRIDDRYATRQQQKPAIRREDLREALDEILAGKAVSVAATQAIGCPLPPGRVGSVSNPRGPQVTYHRDVEPILQQRCQSCHRPGEVGPFSLTSYRQAVRWASDIKSYTQARKMPPWKPVAGAEFAGERRLSDSEIATLAAWVDGGTVQGEPRDGPPPRRFPDGWQLGEPDLVLTMPEEFELGPAGTDLYRCFVLPTALDSDRHVSAVEVRPGNRRIVHHAILFVDRRGQARRNEEQAREKQTADMPDRGPGYSLPISLAFWPGFLPSGALSGWAPGILPYPLAPGAGYRLPRGADVILQLHYHRSGKVEKDLTTVGLYFAKGPSKHVQGLAVPASFLTIPAGASNHRVQGRMWLRQDCQLHTIMPHMHLLGRQIKVTMTPPDGPTRTLVAIDDWDFNWQENFYFKEPLAVKAGTRFDVEGVFDNSSANPFNPFQPPRLIRAGLETTNEMCVGFLGATSDRPGPIRFDVGVNVPGLGWLGGIPGFGL